VHLLGEAGDDRAVLRGAGVEDVRRPISPGGVRHLGDHAVDPSVRGVQEDERDWVEADAQVAWVRQHPHGPSRPPSQPRQDQVPCPFREGCFVARQVVGLPEARRSRMARGPERDPVEQTRQLIEIEEGREDAVSEGVGDRSGSPVRHPALIYGRGCHAASASSWATGSAAPASTRAADAGSCACGSGPRPPSCSATRSADQTPSS
jgi:hypothetical protein